MTDQLELLFQQYSQSHAGCMCVGIGASELAVIAAEMLIYRFVRIMQNHLWNFSLIYLKEPINLNI